MSIHLGGEPWLIRSHIFMVSRIFYSILTTVLQIWQDDDDDGDDEMMILMMMMMIDDENVYKD